MFAIAGAASADGAARHYRIPAQSLDSGLLRLAAESGLEILFTADKVRSINGNNLDGSMTPTEALSKLLQGSGMTYRFVDAGTVTIEPSSNFKKTAVVNEKPQSSNGDTGEGQMMPKVIVEADSAYDPEYYADPYNKDYVLPNATTGTKTDTPIMETPLNVQLIPKQVLKDQQVIRIEQALRNVSGVTATTTNGTFNAGSTVGGLGQLIILRGFASGTYLRNGLRLQTDGSLSSSSKEMANIESVEVLKGPAAILYGLVEPGGMVNVITKQPQATPYYGLTQQFGSYDLYRTSLDATGPISGNKDVMYRANLSYENSGSFRDLVGIENVLFAPVVKWNIGPKTQVAFEVEYNHKHQRADSGFIPFINGQLFNMPRSRNYGEYTPVTSDTIFGGFHWSHEFNDDWQLKHSFSVNQAAATFDNIIPLAAGLKPFLTTILGDDQNLNRVPEELLVARQHGIGISQNNTYSTNLDLTGHFDTLGLKHTLLLGGDYYRTFNRGYQAGSNTSSQFSFISVNNPVHPGFNPFGPISPQVTSFADVDQYGLYIQDQIKLPLGVQVMGGIRYQNIHQSSYFIFPSGDKGGQDVSSQDAVTPRVGILWQPESWVSLYANYAESFGVNTGRTWPNNGIVPPTGATQYEGGIKTEFFGGKLRATLAYYDLAKTNVAVGDINPTHFCAGGGLFSCSLSIGAIRSRGPELDIMGEILPGWNAILNWANTDIRVTKTNAAGEAINGSSPGDRLSGVPRNTGSLWSTYEVQGGDLKGFTIGGGVTVRDSLIIPSRDERSRKLAGYATLDLIAGYSRKVGDAKVSIQLNVNNLLNKHYLSSLFLDPSVQAGYADFGQPRTFMGQISIQY